MKIGNAHYYFGRHPDKDLSEQEKTQASNLSSGTGPRTVIPGMLHSGSKSRKTVLEKFLRESAEQSGAPDLHQPDKLTTPTPASPPSISRTDAATGRDDAATFTPEPFVPTASGQQSPSRFQHRMSHEETCDLPDRGALVAESPAAASQAAALESQAAEKIEARGEILKKLNAADSCDAVATLLDDPAIKAQINAELNPNSLIPLPLIQWAFKGVDKVRTGSLEQKSAEYAKIIDLYVESGADPNRKDQRNLGCGNTPLMWTIANAQTEAALCFIQRPDVDIGIKDAYGKTALHFAITKGITHVDQGEKSVAPMGNVVGALIERAHGNKGIINARDGLGNTPLHYAVVHREPGLLEQLNNAGADRTLRNRDGKTPLDLLELDHEGANKMLNRLHRRVYTMRQKNDWESAAGEIRRALEG